MDTLKYWTYKITATPTWLTIGAGFLLLIWQQGTGNLTPSVQMVFFAFFIFFTGIPHGAIDHLVEKETAEREQKRFNLPLFLAKYVLTMLFYAAAWFFFPSLSLLFFIIMSAWHFGETDIENAPPTPLWNGTRFTFGCFILLWILFFHVLEVTPILERISGNNTLISTVWLSLSNAKITVLLTLASLTGIFSYFAHQNQSIHVDKMRFLRLTLIITLTYFLPLLPAFALYFGGWHALCSFSNIHAYLQRMGDNPTTLSPYSILKTWSKTLIFSLLALLSLTFTIWYWLRFYQTWDPLPLLFIFLSLITLPHLNVMHRMSKNTSIK